MKKRKRKFKLFLLLFVLGLIGYAFYYIDKNDNEYSKKELNEKLIKLGYSQKTVDKIIELELENKIIDLDKYHKIIDESIKEEKFNKDCFDSYISLNNENEVYKLCNLNYSNSEIIKIVENLNKDDINSIKTYMKELHTFVEYKNFMLKNYNRYTKHAEKDIHKRISLVNLNLDYPFYENIQEAINLNTNLVLVNKYYKLDNSYPNKTLYNIKKECAVRSDIKLDKEAKEAFEKLCDKAKEEGFTIKGSSGYRSYETQRIIYNNYLKTDKIRDVDTYSARAGHSEHQTGLAIDVYNGSIQYNKFGSTDDYIWAKDNIHKFGFIIRYTKENEYITGYMDEPWHLRYVGVDVATYIYKNNITFEEYLLNNKEKI